jgi:hypothetical protein
MSDIMEQEKMEFTSDDILRSAVQVRINGLETIINEIAEETRVEQIFGTNGLPQLRAALDDREIVFSYLPVGDEGTDRFILLVRSVVKVAEEDDAGNMLPCESFNLGSPFGFAVYDPVSGAVELRAQIPEIGGLSERDQYEHILELFSYSVDELNAALQ